MARNDAGVNRRTNHEAVASVLTGLCMDCGVDTLAAGEYYALKDALWRGVNPLVFGMLCLTCTEDRLGRSLNRADFARAAINTQSATKCASLVRRLVREPGKRSMNKVKPRARKIAGKRDTQSRLGYTSFQLLAYVGRNGRVKPSDLMSVVRSSIPSRAPPREHLPPEPVVAKNSSRQLKGATLHNRKNRRR